MTLGQRISAYRKTLGISQEELGARLGVSRQAVSKWETALRRRT
ncbi:helix-turn-helix transcriptional regulator [Dysosmobacter sp.]